MARSIERLRRKINCWRKYGRECPHNSSYHP